MNISNISIEELINRLVAFRDEREWKQFHTPRQLSAAIAIETSELQETMLWKTDSEIEKLMNIDSFRSDVGDEIADILSFTLLLANEFKFNIFELIEDKIKKNQERYPAEKSRGRSTKHNKL